MRILIFKNKCRLLYKKNTDKSSLLFSKSECEDEGVEVAVHDELL